jgi:hypothetical protein
LIIDSFVFFNEPMNQSMNQSINWSLTFPNPRLDPTINVMRLALIVLTSILSTCVAHAQGAPPRREDPLQSKLQSARQLEMIEAALMRRHPQAPARQPRHNRFSSDSEDGF